MSSKDIPQPEFAGAPAKDDAPRESLAEKIRPFVLVLLLVVLPVVLFYAFTQHMYVCRIPAGTKFVNTSSIPPPRSILGDYIYDSALIRKWHWDWLIPYLGYRHCIIPEGAEEIAFRSFTDSDIRDDLRSVRIPGSVKKIGDGAFMRCGKLTDIKVVRGVDKALDDEAVRVVKSSPKWTPGKQRDRAVKVTYTFPVIFELR